MKLLGSVEFVLIGLKLEPVLQRAARAGVTLTRLERVSAAQLRVTVPYAQHRKFLRQIPKNSVLVKRVSARGAGIRLQNAKSRLALLITLVLAASLLAAVSTRVWQVTVYGSEILEKSIIIDCLRQAGYAPGANPPPEMLENWENALLRDIPLISFASVSRRGAELVVRIKEREKTAIENQAPADIVARKDCRIVSVTVLQGRSMVLEGQIVQKGQVLISGQLLYSLLPYRYVQAAGDVYGEVWYTASCPLVREKTVTVRTGKKYTRRYIRLFGQDILLGPEPDFAPYQTEYGQPAKGVLAMGEITYYQTAQRRVTISEEEALREAQRVILEQLLYQVPLAAEQLEEKLTVAEENGKKVAYMYIKTRELVGKQVKILQNTIGN